MTEIEAEWAKRLVKDSERRAVSKIRDAQEIHLLLDVLKGAMRDATYESEASDFEIVKAPWTKAQVEALKVWQEGSLPFKLSGPSEGDFILSGSCAETKLVPTRMGWKSPLTGKIVQKWTRRFMLKLAEDDGLGFRVTGSRQNAISEAGSLPDPRASAKGK